MRHHIRAVLFDLDTAVVDTSSFHFAAWKRLADEQGWDLEPRMAESIAGVPRMECLRSILECNDVRLAQEEQHALASRKNAFLVEMLCDIGEKDLRPGVGAFLDKLKKRGVKLGLYSLSASAAIVSERLGLGRWFDAVVTGTDVQYADWDTGVFEACAARLRIPAFHCLVVENVSRAIRAAQSARMKVVGIGEAGRGAGARDTFEEFAEVNVDFLLDSGRPVRFVEEPWHVSQTVVSPARSRYWESVFALSNGLLGMRGAHEEDEPVLHPHSYPGMFVNGVYGYRPYQHAAWFPGFPHRLHMMLNLADWRILNLYVDGERFSLFSGEVHGFRRSLDMKRGVVERSLVWTSPAGRRVSVRSTRLVSMHRRHCAAIRFEVTPVDGAVELRFESSVHATVASEELGERQTEVVSAQADENGLALHVRPATAEADVGMCFVHMLSGGTLLAAGEYERTDDAFCCLYEVSARKGQTAVFDKYAAFASSIETDGRQVVDTARREALRAAADGFGRLLEEQSAFWAGYWKHADIEVEGQVGDQQALRFNLFHLRQSNPEDDRRSIGANGMTGDRYRGHVFWDTEMYLVPHLLYTEPHTVRSLLMYRYNILDMARRRAREMDGRGALYAWNSISGEECGVVFEASTAEYHLQSAIAWAVHRYCEATGDRDFLYNYGAEMLFETARFLAGRGCWVQSKGNRFCINVVCGPDEYGCGVNNNCYTNVMAQWHLTYAAEVYGRMGSEAAPALEALAGRIELTQEEVAAWREAAARMYVPYNAQLGIHEQDDSFLQLDPVDMALVPRNTDIREQMHPLNLWRMQVAKQADVVLLMFVQGYQFDLETKRRNYEFYEPRTCHGSSLSACIHAVEAAEVGRPVDAYDFFRESAMMDLNDFKDNTGGGIHAACLGGTWMAVVNGFGGMRDYPDGLHFAPCLPAAWQRCRFRVLYRGSRIAVTMERDRTVFELLEGPEVRFRVRETELSLGPDCRSVDVPA